MLRNHGRNDRIIFFHSLKQRLPKLNLLFRLRWRLLGKCLSSKWRRVLLSIVSKPREVLFAQRERETPHRLKKVSKRMMFEGMTPDKRHVHVALKPNEDILRFAAFDSCYVMKSDRAARQRMKRSAPTVRLGRTLAAQEFKAKDAEHDQRDASDSHDG